MRNLVIVLSHMCIITSVCIKVTKLHLHDDVIMCYSAFDTGIRCGNRRASALVLSRGSHGGVGGD